jgi:Fe-S cluster assembly protein SufD
MTQLQERQDQFLAHFERFELGGSEAGPEWLLPIRKAAIARFAELGFPTTKHEEWRYTNVSPIAETPFEPARPNGADIDAKAIAPYTLGRGVGHLAVFVNGRFAPNLSSIGSLPRGVKISGLAEAIESDARLVREHLARHIRYDDQPFIALNTAMMEDGGFVYVPRATVLEEPIHLLHLTTPNGSPIAVHPRNLIVVDDTSQATIVESYVGLGEGVYFNNVVTELVAGNGAIVDHHKVQREGREAYHIAALQMHQLRDSNVASHNMSFGGGLVRNDVNAWLDGEGGYATMTGLSLVDGERHMDNHLYVDHAKPHCGSREFYKAILEEKGTSIFSGRIIVRKDAQKTDAKQTNQSLLLSRDAQVESKPQLEIFADDVKCTHGATIGQVSEEAIFYLRARGVPEATARSLLIYAFAGESVTEIKLEPLRTRLEELVLNWLPQSKQLKAIV